MKKKLLSIALTVILGAGALVGCNSSAAGGEKKADKELVVAYYADFRGKNSVDEYLKRFTEETGIKAQGKPVTGDFFDSLKTGFASKTEPDVFFMDIYQFGNFADAGLLLDLNEYISDEHKASFNENLLNMFTYEDKLYGIPKDYNTLGLYYNKTMFDEVGVSYPTDEWTWDDLLQASEKIKAHYDGKGKYALVLQNELPRFQPILEASGADFGYKKDGYPTVNTQQAVEGLTNWINLFEQGYATTPKDLGKDWDGDSFDNQLAAMTIDGNWMNSYLTSSGNDVDYGTTSIPSINGKKSNMFFTVSWSASANTKQPENAAKFIEWITTETMGREFMEDGGGAIPANKALEEEFITAYPERKMFVDVADYASAYDYGLVSPAVVKEFADIAERLRLGSATDVKAELDKVQEAINKEYNRLSK